MEEQMRYSNKVLHQRHLIIMTKNQNFCFSEKYIFPIFPTKPPHIVFFFSVCMQGILAEIAKVNKLYYKVPIRVVKIFENCILALIFEGYSRETLRKYLNFRSCLRCTLEIFLIFDCLSHKWAPSILILPTLCLETPQNLDFKGILRV